MKRPAVVALFVASLVLAVPLAALAQTTTTEPYSGGEVTETTITPRINVMADGLTVAFTATGVGNDCSWDFGDGASGSGNPATHTYDAEGDYTITATCGVQVLSRTVHFAENLNFTGMDVLPYAGGAIALLLIGLVVVRANPRSKKTD